MPDNANQITKEGYLAWTGPLAADGCGYFITVDDEELKPINDDEIPAEFQVTDDEVAVVVTYIVLDEPQTYSCGMMGTQMEATIKVIKVERR